MPLGYWPAPLSDSWPFCLFHTWPLKQLLALTQDLLVYLSVPWPAAPHYLLTPWSALCLICLPLIPWACFLSFLPASLPLSSCPFKLLLGPPLNLCLASLSLGLPLCPKSWHCHLPLGSSVCHLAPWHEPRTLGLPFHQFLCLHLNLHLGPLPFS